MNRPVHFELHAPDPQAAMRFYEQVFGWQFQSWQGDEQYWLVQTGEGEGINGGLMRSRDGQPRTVNTIAVDDVDAYAGKVTQAGGQVVVPKCTIAGVGYVAYCTDPGGLIFGIFQSDPRAGSS